MNTIRTDLLTEFKTLKSLSDTIEEYSEYVTTLNEPEAIYEANEELLELIDKYKQDTKKTKDKLARYVQNCKLNDEIMDITLYRLYKQFKKDQQ